eukprot:3162923-Amphidinium_carterae.1
MMLESLHRMTCQGASFWIAFWRSRCNECMMIIAPSTSRVCGMCVLVHAVAAHSWRALLTAWMVGHAAPLALVLGRVEGRGTNWPNGCWLHLAQQQSARYKTS